MPFDMPTNPDTDNYTVPGGIRLYFDDGSGLRDLGNIASLDMEPGSDVLEHFSNLSGKRMKDKKLTIEEKLTFNVTLDEPNSDNMWLFFRGGNKDKTGEKVKFALAGVGTIEGAARLEVHPASGRGHKFDLVFGKASISAKGAMSLDDKDWMKLPLVLEVLDNSGAEPNYPFGYYQGYGVGSSTALTTTTTTSTSTTTTT
jgi:hypothetical protein